MSVDLKTLPIATKSIADTVVLTEAIYTREIYFLSCTSITELYIKDLTPGKAYKVYINEEQYIRPHSIINILDDVGYRLNISLYHKSIHLDKGLFWQLVPVENTPGALYFITKLYRTIEPRN